MKDVTFGVSNSSWVGSVGEKSHPKVGGDIAWHDGFVVLQEGIKLNTMKKCRDNTIDAIEEVALLQLQKINMYDMYDC